MADAKAVARYRKSRLALISFAATAILTVAATLLLGEIVGRWHGGYGAWAEDPSIGARALLPVPDHVAAKLAWAKALSPRTLVVLGNSRTVFLSAEDLGVSGDEFANLSVGGTTFRQSIRTLEYLAATGRAPKTAVVNIDPWPLGPWGEADYPPAFLSPDHAVDDAYRILKRGGQWRVALNSLSHDLQLAATSLRNGLKNSTVLMRLSFLWGKDKAGSGRPPFAADGHIPQQIPVRTGPPQAAPQPSALPEKYLGLMEERYRNDLDRLAELSRRHGTRVLIMETPLDPDSTRAADARPDHWFKAARARFSQECRQRGIEARLDPPIAPGDDGTTWPDCCHAPAPYLAEIIRKALD